MAEAQETRRICECLLVYLLDQLWHRWNGTCFLRAEPGIQEDDAADKRSLVSKCSSTIQ